MLDTGPLVAYLDANEPEHSNVVPCLDGFAGQLPTTGAVITEAMHFVSTDPEGAGVLAAFVEASGMLVFDFAQPAQLRNAALLMKKYADTPRQAEGAPNQWASAPAPGHLLSLLVICR